MTDWIILESRVHPTVRDRMARNLASVDHRIRGDAVQVPDSPGNRRVIGLMDELLSCHERILHYAEPDASRPYKPLERDVLFVALAGVLERHPDANGPVFLADLLHSLVWAQGLPNTNHRSTLLLVNSLAWRAGGEIPAEPDVQAAMTRFISQSKPLIREKEFRPRADALRVDHLAAAEEYLSAISPEGGR